MRRPSARAYPAAWRRGDEFARLVLARLHGGVLLRAADGRRDGAGMMGAWLHNAAVGLIMIIWVGGSAAALAWGIQGTWAEQLYGIPNKYWPGALALGAIGMFTFLVTFATFIG